MQRNPHGLSADRLHTDFSRCSSEEVRVEDEGGGGELLWSQRGASPLHLSGGRKFHMQSASTKAMTASPPPWVSIEVTTPSLRVRCCRKQP